MAWVLPCPATNPITRSPAGTVIGPALGEVLLFEAPAAVSRGLVAATPEYSCTWKATELAAVCTVTDVTDLAAGVYQISPSELCPAMS